MAIEKIVSSDFFYPRSSIVKSGFDCRLFSVRQEFLLPRRSLYDIWIILLCYKLIDFILAQLQTLILLNLDA